MANQERSSDKGNKNHCDINEDAIKMPNKTHIDTKDKIIITETVHKLARTSENDFGFNNLKVIVDFINEEQNYISRLKGIENSRNILASYSVPESDLKCLLGFTREIREYHEFHVLLQLQTLKEIEDLLDFFIKEEKALKIYVLHQWTKSENEFYGKDVLLKRLAPDVVKDLNLPETRIKEYLNLYEVLKINLLHLRTSHLFLKSFDVVRTIFLQILYAKELASVNYLPSTVDYLVLLVDNFQVKIDNGQFSPYRVYCCAEGIYFVTDFMNYDFNVNNREISFNQMESDDLLFEIRLVRSKNKSTMILKSESTGVKAAWTEILNNILFKQAEEAKEKIRNSLTSLAS